jgi:hypothetical protein
VAEGRETEGVGGGEELGANDAAPRSAQSMAKKLPPVHPGEVLREEFLIPMKLSAYSVAKACGVPHTRIERLIREETR